MNKLICLLGILFFTTLSVFASAEGCQFNLDDPLSAFKNCSPTGVIQQDAKPKLGVTTPGGDFIPLVEKIVSRVQLIAFFISVGIIVWIGLLMVLPANAEAKEATKGKLISVLIGFLVMLAATIIINIFINSIYGIFK